MEKNSKNINRRSFIGTTGAIAAGMTLIPGSFSIIPDVIANNKSQGSMAIGGTGKIAIEKWWEKEPLRIVELEQGYEFGEKFEILKDLGANMEHLTRFTDTSPGTSFLDAHNLFKGKKVNFKTLEDYLAEAHKRDIRVIIYYNVHAIEISYAQQHRDWQQIKDDGKPIEDVYSVDSSFCINSPWREEVFQTIRKLALYKIDGVFYDGPIFFSNTCRCESCKRLFRERYLKEMPSKTELSSKRDSSDWNDLIEFQSDSIADFLRETNTIIKNINPQILLYMNGNTLAPSWPTGRDNRKIIKETDILGAEGGFLYGEFKEPVYKPGAMAKLLEAQAGGKPTVVFDAGKQGPWAFSTLPAGEISILYSQTITNQANVWLAISDKNRFHDKELDVIKRYNRFINENHDPFFRTKSMAKIALLWPQKAGNFYSGSSVPLTDFTKETATEKAGNTGEEFYGFYDGLSRGHFPFDVIDEECLNDDLARYDLVILPNLTCLKKEKADKIRNFVKEGGNIISTFETSLYNETGEKLDNFELHDVLGIESSGDVFGPLKWDYVYPKDNLHFSLKEIKNNYIIAPYYGLKLKTTANVPLFFCNPLPGSYSGSPKASEFPFIIENQFGKGKSIYFAGTFGGSLYKFRSPEYYQILFNMVSEFSKPFVMLENAPSSVEVNVRRKENSVFLYLINFTSEMRRPIQEIIPCTNIKINVLLNEKVKSLRSLWQKRDLKFTAAGSSITFVLPVIKDYEVLEILL
ncbi:MAG TPA: beta-galactosidase trimerization domain-containing protein [Bacteroidales bacterium]|nr:beta-galactosidase trimerization domain-containing protein [Bacteroidales bacterium]HPT22100.1 beta-galactosidase trimerization domain-containing protein [Bacteroidales bacterium]